MLTLSIYIHLIPGELAAPAELDAMLPPQFAHLRNRRQGRQPNHRNSRTFVDERL
jgi:hypothetical protein